MNVMFNLYIFIGILIGIVEILNFLEWIINWLILKLRFIML